MWFIILLASSFGPNYYGHNNLKVEELIIYTEDNWKNQIINVKVENKDGAKQDEGNSDGNGDEGNGDKGNSDEGNGNGGQQGTGWGNENEENNGGTQSTRWGNSSII